MRNRTLDSIACVDRCLIMLCHFIERTSISLGSSSISLARLNSTHKTTQIRQRTYVGELNNTKASEVSQTTVSSVFVDNQGDVLHRLRTEPLRHLDVVSGCALQLVVCCLGDPEAGICVGCRRLLPCKRLSLVLRTKVYVGHKARYACKPTR